MVALTDRQMGWLHDELGEDVPDVDLQAVFERKGSVRETAIVIVRRRITALQNQPLQVGVAGVGNFTFSENLKSMERQLKRLEAMDDDPSDDTDTDSDPDDDLPVIQVRSLPRRRRRR